MATRALDVVTILYALEALGKELQTTVWKPSNLTPIDVFKWLATFKGQLARIRGLDAKASRFYEELNAFLTQRGFSPMIQPFNPRDSLGVVSILDKLVRWLNGPGAIGTISTSQGALPGFELPPEGVNIYEVKGYPGSTLLQLLTQSDETLWVFVHPDASREGLDLVKLSMDVMRQPRKTPMSREPTGWRRAEWPTWAGAKVPMIDLSVNPDLRWLLGAQTITASGDRYVIVQAAQQFKMRMDETGARVSVGTSLETIKAMILSPQLFVVDRPFYGWWTQRGIDLPLAAFFADWDCWRKPRGSLQHL